MKYLIVIMLFWGISSSSVILAQGVDSSLIVKPKTKGIIEIKLQKQIQEQIQEQKQNNNDFKYDKKSSNQYFNKKVEKFIIDETQKIDEVKALILEPDELETNIKKRIINGPSQFDSRIELRNLSPLIEWQKQVLNNANSVGIIVEREMIHQVTDSIYQLDISNTLGTLYNLCTGEAFRDQPVVGVGTAFIIDELTMITASHVLGRPVKNYVVVFGFEMVNKVGAYEAFISAKDIYSLATVLCNSDNLDVTTFKVDRPIDRPVLKWCNSLSVPDNSSVYMIGHPMGLPKKAALNATMKNNENPFFFYTSLDAFQGNSGSPVFRFDTNEVIGILVSGELDYKWNGSCNASTLCSIPYCKGEKAIRIEEIMNELSQK